MAALAALYAAFLKAENRVGGGEGLVGIYGSMTQQGTSLIMAAMAEHAGLCSKSILVDIGCGLCRPLLHACVEHGVGRAYGVELDAVKCQKAIPFVQHTVGMMAKEGFTLPETALPTIICMSVELMGSLEPATHAYAAWEGFPETAKQAIGALFRCSPTLTAITIVQRSMRNQDPEEVMAELGFGDVECQASALPVHMAGSRRKLNAYLFVKRTSATMPPGSTEQPPRPGPCLLTATPFNPAEVLSELSRMTSNGGPQPRSSAAGWPAQAASAATGSPASDRTTCHSTAAAMAPCQAPAGGAARHHEHGLRPRRASAPSVQASATKRLPSLTAASSGSQPDMQALALQSLGTKTSPGSKRSVGDVAAAEATQDVVPLSQASHELGGPARAQAGVVGRKPRAARALEQALLSTGKDAAGPGYGSQQDDKGNKDVLKDVVQRHDQFKHTPVHRSAPRQRKAAAQQQQSPEALPPRQARAVMQLRVAPSTAE